MATGQTPPLLPTQAFQFMEGTHSKHLNCKICLQLMLEPIRLHACGHTFCKKCVSQKTVKKCPLCLEKIKTKQKDILASRLVGQLGVRCLHEGCPWKGTLMEFRSFHRDGCKLKQGGMQQWLKLVEESINFSKSIPNENLLSVKISHKQEDEEIFLDGQQKRYHKKIENLENQKIFNNVLQIKEKNKPLESQFTPNLQEQTNQKLDKESSTKNSNQSSSEKNKSLQNTEKKSMKPINKLNAPENFLFSKKIKTDLQDSSL